MLALPYWRWPVDSSGSQARTDVVMISNSSAMIVPIKTARPFVSEHASGEPPLAAMVWNWHWTDRRGYRGGDLRLRADFYRRVDPGTVVDCFTLGYRGCLGHSRRCYSDGYRSIACRAGGKSLKPLRYLLILHQTRWPD